VQKFSELLLTKEKEIRWLIFNVTVKEYCFISKLEIMCSYTLWLCFMHCPKRCEQFTAGTLNAKRIYSLEEMESVRYIIDIANPWVSGAALFSISSRSVGKRRNTSSVVGHCIL
jgi:hypothetical protein